MVGGVKDGLEGLEDALEENIMQKDAELQTRSEACRSLQKEANTKIQELEVARTKPGALEADTRRILQERKVGMESRSRTDTATSLSANIQFTEHSYDDIVAAIANRSARVVPSMFLCLISKKVMHNPHVAADGFTYEMEAIKEWVDGGNDTFSVTGENLPHKNLIPNLPLRSAVRQWEDTRPCASD